MKRYLPRVGWERFECFNDGTLVDPASTSAMRNASVFRWAFVFRWGERVLWAVVQPQDRMYRFDTKESKIRDNIIQADRNRRAQSYMDALVQQGDANGMTEKQLENKIADLLKELDKLNNDAKSVVKQVELLRDAVAVYHV